MQLGVRKGYAFRFYRHNHDSFKTGLLNAAWYTAAAKRSAWARNHQRNEEIAGVFDGIEHDW